jgi:hypothetical protein
VIVPPASVLARSAQRADDETLPFFPLRPFDDAKKALIGNSDLVLPAFNDISVSDDDDVVVISSARAAASPDSAAAAVRSTSVRLSPCVPVSSVLVEWQVPVHSSLAGDDNIEGDAYEVGKVYVDFQSTILCLMITTL